MNTQTHVLLAAALLAKPGEPARNTAIVAGALVPDLAIYTLFVWSKFAGIPERTVWSQLYYQPPWSDAVTAGNAAPLYIALLVIGIAASQWTRLASLLTYYFAGRSTPSGYGFSRPCGRCPCPSLAIDGMAFPISHFLLESRSLWWLVRPLRDRNRHSLKFYPLAPLPCMYGCVRCWCSLSSPIWVRRSISP